MTTETAIKHLQTRTGEFLDSFVVVGFVHGNQNAVIIRHAPNDKDWIGLVSLMQAACSAPPATINTEDEPS